MKTLLLLALLLPLLPIQAEAKTQRSHQAKAEFKRANPCPATGKTRGPCPGYQIDHVWALCAGGADRPENMQWLAVDLHTIKTRSDTLACRRKVPPPVAD